MLWDIFCKVIDNHGDIGVCWRLSAELARRGERVRLRVDDASALAWMAPRDAPGVEVLPWSHEPAPGDVVIEAFGCELPHEFQAALAAATRARGSQPPWINLEYLTAESFAQRCHGLPSPVMSGPAAGLTKRFFYPGFTTGTGGLLRELGLEKRQSDFDARKRDWLRSIGVEPGPQRLVSLFCYEPPLLAALLRQLANDTATPTHLLVTSGRATAALREALGTTGELPGLQVTWLPLFAQEDFDHLLWSCDVNFVRGEDSVVRALWAGKPFVWQLYPQQDGAHHDKLDAFMDWMQAPESLRRFHEGWNGVSDTLPPFDPAAWSDCVAAARQKLLVQEDLVTQLMRFAEPRS